MLGIETQREKYLFENCASDDFDAAETKNDYSNWIQSAEENGIAKKNSNGVQE